MSEASLFNLKGLEEAPAAAPDATDSAPGESASRAMMTHSGSQSLSLYRKYRPQSFDADDLFGQEHIVNTLRNAIALDRIAHAYLFCGPRGTGKTTTARLLAKAVNCLDPDPHKRPCNRCPACDAINRNATTDIIEIDAASNRGIDDIRDLRERVKYAPTQMKTKFYIIDEAHQITGAAANAFLKTLEEPPAHTKFVLATTDPEELLQTIVSRCQRFDFRRINIEAMIACLQKVSMIEQIAIDDDAMQIIARHATGSMRDALGLLDQVAVYRDSDDDTNDRVTATTVRTVLGVSRNERVETLVTALADRDASAGLIAINQAAEAGDDIRQLGRQLVAFLRTLLLEQAGGTSDADPVAKGLATRFSLQELAELARTFSEVDFKAKHATFAQLPLEIAFVEAAHRGSNQARESVPAVAGPRSQAQAAPPPKHAAARETEERSGLTVDPSPRQSLRDRVRGQSQPARSINEAQARSKADAPSIASQEEVATAASTAARSSTSGPAEHDAPPSNVAPGTALSLDVIVDLWSKIRADVKSVNRRIEALLQQVDPVTINGSAIVLASPYEFHRNRVNSDEARHVIEDVISRLMQQRVQISCVTRDEALAMVGGSAQSTSVRESNSSGVQSDPSAAHETLPPTVGSPDETQAGTVPETHTATSSAAEELADSPSTVSSLEDDERRIQAAKNIFDAEESDD